MNPESISFFEWILEKSGNIPPVIIALLGFIVAASILILIISFGIIAFDKVRWVFDIEVRMAKEPSLLYSLLGEQLFTELIFLTFSESLEITGITSRLVKDGIDAFGEVANLEIIKVDKINQNLKSEKVEKFEYSSAIDLLPAFSTSRQQIFFSIKNGENKVKSLIDNFKIQVFNFIKQAEEYKLKNGAVNKDYVRRSLLDLKNSFISEILDAIKIIDGDYKLEIEVQYRILNEQGRKSKDQFSSTQHINFRVQKVKELLRLELDDLLGKLITNILNSPATPSKINPITISTTKLQDTIAT